MDRSTPNLPSRDFDITERFYLGIGFARVFRDDGWMILRRGTVDLEFFPHPGLDSERSWFSCCLRLDDVDAFHIACRDAAIPEGSAGHPRLQAPSASHGLRMGALVDPDGTLVRVIGN